MHEAREHLTGRRLEERVYARARVGAAARAVQQVGRPLDRHLTHLTAADRVPAERVLPARQAQRVPDPDRPELLAHRLGGQVVVDLGRRVYDRTVPPVDHRVQDDGLALPRRGEDQVVVLRGAPDPGGQATGAQASERHRVRRGGHLLLSSHQAGAGLLDHLPGVTCAHFVADLPLRSEAGPGRELAPGPADAAEGCHRGNAGRDAAGSHDEVVEGVQVLEDGRVRGRVASREAGRRRRGRQLSGRNLRVGHAGFLRSVSGPRGSALQSLPGGSVRLLQWLASHRMRGVGHPSARLFVGAARQRAVRARRDRMISAGRSCNGLPVDIFRALPSDGPSISSRPVQREGQTG